jgi:DNA replication and repair protein RecF
MALVSRIQIKNFRSHDDFNADLDKNVTIITGKNGAGKTSILESIYYLSRGNSFKGTARDILKSDSTWWTIKAKTENDNIFISYSEEEDTPKKKYKINEQNFSRVPNKHKIPVVLFEPEELRLINGSPARRRKFLDQFIGQIDPHYQMNLRRYEKALKQRNSLLKKPSTKKDDMFVWNIALGEYGAYITEKRSEFVKDINNKINDVYRSISDNKDEIKIEYSYNSSQNIQQKLFSELENSFERDRILGTSSVGPHRHDIKFVFNNTSAKEIASRGEIRTIVLALKFIEMEIIEKIYNDKPIILLDDVYGELDESRQKKLGDMTKDHQVIITSSHSVDINTKHKTILLN